MNSKCRREDKRRLVAARFSTEIAVCLSILQVRTYNIVYSQNHLMVNFPDH